MLSQPFNANIMKYIALWGSIDGRNTFLNKQPWYNRHYRYYKIRRQLKHVIN